MLLCRSILAQTVGEPGSAGASQSLQKVEIYGTAGGEGSARNGYRSETATSTGPWGTRKLQETPYTITVLSAELIENSAARSVDQLFKMAPLVQAGQSQDINGIAQATIRGFNVARVYVNGIQNNNLGFGVFAEEIERLEIINGLSGFLYGASPVGGVINYEMKRPTATPLRKVTLGNYGGEQYYLHGDFGGPIDTAGKLSYRLNLLYQDGDTAIDQQSLQRHLASAALAWRPTNDLDIQFQLADKRHRLDGRPYQFFLGANVPAPLDGHKLYAPRDTFVDVRSDEADLSLRYKLSDSLSLRTALQRKKDDRAMVYAIGSLGADESTYAINIFGGRNDALSTGGYAYLDADFTTGTVRHRLTFGFNGYRYRNRLATFPTGQPFYFAPSVTSTFDNPDAIGIVVPAWDLSVRNWVVNARSSNLNAVLADDIRIDERWSVMLGLNHSKIHSRSYDIFSGALLPEASYEKSALTPTVSVLYKPAASVTTYVTYIESLEQGSIVGDTYKNAGQTLAPLKSRQYELGVKAELAPLQLGAALFQIDKANEISDDGTPTGTYIQDGRQIHRGLELSAVGRPLRNLTLMAGLTLMNNTVRRSSDPAIEGKEPNWVADKVMKVYAEYSPETLAGWTFTGGVYFTGSSYQDAINTRKVPGYTLLDVGGRYVTQVFGKRTQARLSVQNAADRRYWAASSPGAPRTIAFSVSAEL